MKQAIEDLLLFTRDKTLQEYENDRLLRHATERLFEILGEALGQLRIHHPDVFSQLQDTAVFIAFRNVVIHRYAELDDTLVWLAAHSDKLPALLSQISSRLEELDRSANSS